MPNEDLNAKTKKMVEFADYIVKNSCFQAEKNGLFEPRDMPNVFITCVVRMMVELKISFCKTEEEKKTLDFVAQNAVSGLVKSLEMNGFIFEAVVPEPNAKEVGIAIPYNAGRA